eukprot:jgi/Chlat1/122/Chrsp1S00223
MPPHEARAAEGEVTMGGASAAVDFEEEEEDDEETGVLGGSDRDGRVEQSRATHARMRRKKSAALSHGHHGPIGKDASPLSAYFNLMMSLLGTGMLALPAAFKSSGIIGGAVSLTAFAAITAHSIRLLVRSKHGLPKGLSRDRYDDIGAAAFGKAGRIAANLAVVSSQLGFACSHIVFAVDNIHDLFTPLGPVTLVLLLWPCGVLLQFIRRLDSLAQVSLVAIVFVLMSIVAVFVDGATHGLPLHYPWDSSHYGPPLKWRTYADFFGIAVFAYCCQAVVVPLEGSLRPQREDKLFPVSKSSPASVERESAPLLDTPNSGVTHTQESLESPTRADNVAKRFLQVADLSLVSVTVLYIAFGALGYMFYGENVHSVITANLSAGWAGVVVRAGLSSMTILSLPALIASLQSVFTIAMQWQEAAGYLKEDDELWSLDFWKRNAVRGTVASVPFLLAALLPCFAQVTNLVGGFCNAFMAFILPPLFYMKLFWDRISQQDLTVCLLILVVGLIGFVSTTAACVREIAAGVCN